MTMTMTRAHLIPRPGFELVDFACASCGAWGHAGGSLRHSRRCDVRPRATEFLPATTAPATAVSHEPAPEPRPVPAALTGARMTEGERAAQRTRESCDTRFWNAAMNRDD